MIARAGGEVDLYGTTLGFALQAKERGIAEIILKESDVRGHLWHSWALVTTVENIEKRRELISRVVNYIKELIKLSETDREYAVSLMMKEPPAGYGYSKATAESYYDEMLWNYVGAPNLTALNNIRDEYVALGVLKSLPPIEKIYVRDFL